MQLVIPIERSRFKCLGDNKRLVLATRKTPYIATNLRDEGVNVANPTSVEADSIGTNETLAFVLASLVNHINRSSRNVSGALNLTHRDHVPTPPQLPARQP